MNLDEAVAAFEKEHCVHPTIGNYSKTDEGHEYVAVVSGGIKPEGQRFPAFYTTPELAAEAWLETARKYAHRTSKIFWREHPSVSERTLCDALYFGTGIADYHLYVVYSRFVAVPLEEGPW